MKITKRIWELQSSTICKVIGMAFHLKDLRKIARKFGISYDDSLMDEEFVLHSTVVRLCNSDNTVSRYTEKALEKRFVVHERKLPLDDPVQVIKTIRNNPTELQAPLWAILWGLATRSQTLDVKIESSLFGFIHVLEHRLVRDHWKTMMEQIEDGSEDINTYGEITKLKRELLDMQWSNGKLEKIIENLRAKVTALRTAPFTTRHQSGTGNPTPEPQKNVHDRKLRNMKRLLSEAKYSNYQLEEENAQLKEEIDSLLCEMSRYEKTIKITRTTTLDTVCSCPLELIGKKVTLVGGIESLECHYRQIIESFGGRFSRHDGDCSSGDRRLHDCITSSDLVVCPIGINSHNAARSVKKLCKARGVQCCFPKNASITGLKKALEEHCADQQVA